MIILCFFQAAVAQNVGIGTNTPNASALLELQSTNKGLLLPRVNDTSSVNNPVKGLLLYTNTGNKVWFYNGSFWQEAAAGNTGADGLWQSLGDSTVYTGKKYVGINVNPLQYQPQQGLEVNGNLLIQQKSVNTAALPSAAQTVTMNNTATVQNFAIADSTGRIFDPGGLGINYFNNMQGNISIQSGGLLTGYSVSFNATDFGIAAGDTLWLSQNPFPFCRTDYFHRYTNTTVPPQNINISNKFDLKLVFRSNGDNINNKGFDITWKKLYAATGSSNISYAGNALWFNTTDGSFCAGNISSNIRLGEGAISIGQQAIASGYRSIAMGEYATASDNYSTAVGQFSNASGGFSTAIGYGAKAQGAYATALGNYVAAAGDNAFAIGLQTVAKAYGSLSIGQFNDEISSSNSTTWVPTDPLLILGNGLFSSRRNALVVYKNGNTDIGGFTQLGKSSEAAPAVKMKKLVTTSAATQNGSVTIAHGLTRSKILGVQILLTYAAGTGDIPASYLDVPGYEYNWQLTNTDVWILNKNGNSANILSKAIRILITYEE